MSTNPNDRLSHEDWWNSLSQEERMLAIETVRLDQDADYPHPGRPTGERAEWIRHLHEYRERFMGADSIAQQDAPGFWKDPDHGARHDTEPLPET